MRTERKKSMTFFDDSSFINGNAFKKFNKWVQFLSKLYKNHEVDFNMFKVIRFIQVHAFLCDALYLKEPLHVLKSG